ncbi:hypothetical protein [Natronobacillus azotifigens]|uniref:Uncharacterized protein n=2 Tax=Natronobacillus azotifigens TaxID=472978 RepID=A0A9J6RCL7_9BACI|nr:hypothetical protein [Natronobacillus azotifigens]MCZ0702953.1 hypothetical protein [Natronobacillus azotifigens]
MKSILHSLQAKLKTVGKKVSQDRVLQIILILLLMSNNITKVSPKEEVWYASLIGAGIYQNIKLIIGITLLLFVLFSRRKRKTCKSKSRFLFIYLCAVVIVITAMNTLPQYYDVIYTDGTTYTFVSHRLFRESKSYQLEDIIQCHMTGTSNIWVKMYDGEKIYISYGITTYSPKLEDTYSPGEFEYDIHHKLAENNVQLTIENRDNIAKKIKKYQGRSNMDLWHVYLPKIVTNIP